MAFTVTPTSGDEPYAFSATVTDSVNINGVDYVASFRSSLSSGSCAPAGTAFPLNDTLLNSLLAGDTIVPGYATVPSGSCRTFTLEIRRVSDNVVIASSNATVDNV